MSEEEIIRIVRKTGRCANGAERDGGTIYHAIRAYKNTDISWDKAECGAIPGRLSNGWVDAWDEKQTVTCEKCLSRTNP